MSTSDLTFELLDAPSAEQVNELTDNFFLYAKSMIPGLPLESEDKLFMIRVKDDSQRLIGGIYANCYWDALEIDTLWVADSQRGQGVGAALVQQAEAFAIKHKAGIAFLKTVDAKNFYEKLGYEVYGVLEDRPKGTLLYHMKKRLV